MMANTNIPEHSPATEIASGGRERPLIVMCAFPASGHIQPLLQITAYLTGKGFKVFFLAGEQFEQAARDAGAEPWGNSFGFLTPDIIKGQYDHPQGHLRWNYQLKHIFLDGTPSRHEILKRCLESIAERFPGRQVIILNEVLFLGVLPFYLGAPLPRGYGRLPRIINFHTTINAAVGNDVAPYGSSLPPARDDEDRARYRAMYDEMQPAARETMKYANQTFRALGATNDLKGDFLFNELICQTRPNVLFMACSPSLEYPRPSDMPQTIKYIGGLPLKAQSYDKLVLPSWWHQVVEPNARLPRDDRNRKKVIFVSQGTANIDNYGDLIIPTFRSLANREDVIVIATLGKPGAKLPEDIMAALPPNGYCLIDYIPYNAVLPLTDVFVLNGGYGGFMHGVMNGTPMVLAGGNVADKGEVAARAEWAGIAVNLRTNTPTEAMVRDAVQEALTDRKLKARAMELKAENDAMYSLGTIERQIWEYAE